MSLDAAVDNQAVALAMLGHAAINYDLAPVLGATPGAKAVSTVPLLNPKGAAVFTNNERPVFSAWRKSGGTRLETMHDEVDEVLWYFDYLPPSPEMGNLESRRALCLLAWEAIKGAIRAGQHPAYVDGNGTPIVLGDLGFGEYDITSLRYELSDTPEVAWLRGQVRWDWCAPEDLSAYPDLVEAYFNFSLRPTVQDPANDPLVIARATP